MTSILTDPNADPHLYEPGTQNGLAVAEARLVIQNGLGYDAFMHGSRTRPLARTGSSSRSPTSWASTEGREPAPLVRRPEARTDRQRDRDGLAQVRPRAAARTAAARDASCEPRPAEQKSRSMKSRFAGKPVAYTEPVPGYLLAAAGLRQPRTEHVHARDRGRHRADPAGVAAMTALIDRDKVKVLLYNSQTISPITDGSVQRGRQSQHPRRRRHRDAAARPGRSSSGNSDKHAQLCAALSR